MFAYGLLRKLGSVVAVMFIVATTVFVISRVIPGDPAGVMLGAAATPEEIARLRVELGLDRPLPVQYVEFMGQLLRLDLGQSIFLGQPVLEAIIERSGLTFALCAFATTLSVLIGLPLGIVAGVWRGSWVDRAASGFALLGASLPSFWIALVLIRYLAAETGWFPVSGWGGPDATMPERLHHLILPAIVLALPPGVLLLRTTRAGMMDVLSQDYVRTARAKGLAPWTVVMKHALRNTMLPLVTVIGLTVAMLVGRTVVTETVFGLPGIGNMVIAGVQRRDYPVIQGVLMVISGFYVLLNLFVDILYTRLDPRLRGRFA
ncbi:ABC transporter permease [Roseomonas sp. AR75]|uniref:ABC transporter permease n=1 Tax=Roseomonas sp. AR75 TaxID=2562311 RepID=UPI00197E140E|nr:ABC transporter permease [Roseomonas sp. AR75]